MRLSQWRYLLLDNGVGAAVLNVGINGVIAWAMFHGQSSVPLWGPIGIAVDTAATSLILPFLTCVIVTLLTDWHVRAGRVAALPRSHARGLQRRLPAGTLAQAVVFAVASFVVLVPITLSALVSLGIEQMPFRTFVFFKAGFAVVDGAMVTPLIAWLALSSAAVPVVR